MRQKDNTWRGFCTHTIMRLITFLFSILVFSFSSCERQKTTTIVNPVIKTEIISAKTDIGLSGSKLASDTDNPAHIDTKDITPWQLVNYAESLTGTPYKFACMDPREGFDCSGFINYVFNHFNIAVPRSSVDFTNIERPIELKNTKQGDLILFTGTDSTIRVIGHMGIIVSNPAEGLKFIHSTSGKEYSVTTTPLNAYYQGRFVKVLRIFKQNDVR